MKRSLSIWLMGLGVAASAQALDASATTPTQPSASARKSAGVATTSANRRVAAASSTSSKAVVAAAAPARASFGQMQGLHSEADPLALKSSVALVIDQDTNEVLLSKNSQAVLPIASITKLMTALVVTDAQQSMSEVLTITQEDIDTEKGSRSRLAVGTQLTRGEMLHLALMSSENRAANALGRHYAGGLDAFVAAMNRRAQGLGMSDTHYVEPTGLSSKNQSSAHDLAILVGEAHQNALLREFSTTADAKVAVGKRVMQFRNTNGLVHSRQWDIGLQKTGYISEAGRCVVMQAQLAGRKLIMVLLDSTGKYSRIGDAERIRKWLELATTTIVRPLS
jgi:serine-type D-Ala-D-Ala endopeptidase (penicillin-binding protein 7)